MPSLGERVSRRMEEQRCPVCILGVVGGECDVPDSRGCAIWRDVEGAVGVVRGIRSDKMDPYLDRLREVICSECPHEDSVRICALPVLAAVAAYPDLTHRHDRTRAAFLIATAPV